ncbi:MAG: HEAT repeat domain-containing protein, partial [Acidobacteria bacterium]|nr:HEAT repeat domain-containing protein [Acidobacteriota bacterium]
HQMKDIDRGRIYRLAPPGYKPSAVPVNLETAPGRAAALRSPAQSVRYLAWQRLKDMGEAATGELRGMTKSGDPVLRARALWLLGEPEARAAVRDADPNFRILGIRLLEARGADLVEATRPLLRDPSPQVRREIAVALRNAPGDAAVESLAELARQHDGQDRWYLEALGIGARGRENALYAKLKRDRWDAAYGQLLWEFRPSDALSELIPAARRNPEALTALAASASLEAGRAVAGMVVDAGMGAQALAHLSTRLFSEWIELRKDPPVVAAIRQALGEPKLQASALELVDDLEDPVYGPELQALARSESAPEETRGAAIQALGKTRNREYLAEFQRLMKSGPLALRVKALRAIGYIGPAGMEGDLRKLILSKEPNELRSEAVRVLARSGSGLAMLLDLEQKSELPAEMRTLASNLANMSRDPAIRARAAKLLPRVAGKNQRPLPPPMFLVRQQGDPQRGRQVFMAQEGPKCSGCHNLGEGKPKAGPDLANIGTKLGKDALLDSILNPSAGIAPEFYQWILQTKSQGEVIGVIAEDTPQRVVVRTENGGEIRLKPSDIASRRKSNLSMMPEDLVQHVTEQQLVDLLEFLATLKK